MGDSVFKIPTTTIEFQTLVIMGKTRWKVTLHHFDMSESWCFDELKDAQNAVQVMKGDHPDAEYIETKEGT